MYFKSQNYIEHLYVADAIDAVDSIDDTSENASNTNCTSANIEEFKKELTMKREARHRAIAVISSEMERLRKELDAEKEAHSETLSMLTLLRSVHGDPDLTTGDFAKSTMKQQRNDKSLDESEKVMRRAEARRLTSTLKVKVYSLYSLYQNLSISMYMCLLYRYPTS